MLGEVPLVQVGTSYNGYVRAMGFGAIEEDIVMSAQSCKVEFV